MKTITEQAEETLVQALRGQNDAHANSHCLHIRGQSFRKEDFAALPTLLTNWIGSTDGRMFLCHDQDIFVFSPNLTPKLFEQIKEHVRVRFAYETAMQNRLLSFYDVENNTIALTELAESKLQKKSGYLRKERAEKQAQAKATLKEGFLKMPVNEELAGTLRIRRNTRQRLQVLVVEDDPFSRRLIDTSLSRFLPAFAEDGYAAVNGYLQKAPDIVFLDIDLPDVSGHDVLAKILSFDPAAYIVMLSGNSQSENVTAAVRAGAKGFVGKPFTKEKLLQYIAKCSRRPA